MLTPKDLQKLHGIEFPESENTTEEFVFRLSIMSRDEFNTEDWTGDTITLEVRCPKVRDMILYKKATIYRTDGETVPSEWRADKIEETITSILELQEHRDNIEKQRAKVEAELRAKGPLLDEIRKDLDQVVAKFQTICNELSPNAAVQFYNLCGEAFLRCQTK